MSMNKYMHPRNIYKKPPDFKQLAIEYPEFREFVKQDITGKVSLDFKDVNALRTLSTVLLKKDFGLHVAIPADKLIPTIPLRLNYLLWIEDLMNITHNNLESEEVTGIDIGTGASCVYPLIAAKKFKWNMIATEIDKQSITFANLNVTQNKLNEKIQIIEVTGDSLLQQILENTDKVFDFCMCNPPFFSSTQELHPFFKSRKSNRPHPKNAFCASVREVVVKGGEVEFVRKLIHESKIFSDKIIIFTTMIGHKTSLAPLKTLLRAVEVCSFKQTEFCQGRTTRWGLAWTFQDIDLRSIPTILKQSKCKPKPPLSYIIPKLSDEYDVEHCNSTIHKMIIDLKMEIVDIIKTRGITYELIAHSNTWSNQRRKRRENRQNSNAPGDSSNSSLEADIEEDKMKLESTSDKLSEMNIASTTPKREHEDDDEYYHFKKFKQDETEREYLAKFHLSIKKQNSDVILQLASFDRETNRETLHQILQYIKNNCH